VIGVETSSDGSGPAPPAGSAAHDRAGALRNALFLHAYQHLHETVESAQAVAKACLATRGLDPLQQDPLPIGLMPRLFSMRAALVRAGFNPDEIRESGLVGDARLEGRVVGPITDLAGRIVSFWAWDPIGRKPRCLYADRDWKSRLGLYGIDVALPAALQRDGNLLVVEEILDALLLRSRGLHHVAAIGGLAKEMTPERWNRLATMGVRRATLIADDCPAQGHGVAAAIDSATRAETAPEIYVLRSDNLPALKNLGDIIRTLGIDVVTRLIERDSIHGYSYRAQVLLARHKQGAAWTETTRQAAVDAAMRFYAGAQNSNVSQLNAFFLPPLVDELGLLADGQQSPSLWFDETCQAAEEVSQEVSVKALPVAPQPNRAASTTGRCPIHGCSRMECLCWD
jgi:hypothetical protein